MKITITVELNEIGDLASQTERRHVIAFVSTVSLILGDAFESALAGSTCGVMEISPGYGVVRYIRDPP